jgi:tetratricopeptide (TPR) repeat protein
MSTSTNKAVAPAVPLPLIEELTEHLTRRHIGRGIACLERNAALLAALHPDQLHAGCFLGHLARWVDVGFDRPALVRDLLVRFDTAGRSLLSLNDYMHVRMAESLVAMSDGQHEKALVHLDAVLALALELRDRETQSIANFWKGRCLRNRAEYAEALPFTVTGRDLALELGYPKMAAVMSVLESWLVFQKGRAREAESILRDCEAVLGATDDYVTLGNIHSSYGRIARRERRYEQAIEHFTRAIAEYRKAGPHHRNLARSLTNIAIVKRYIALQLRDRIDAEAQRHRTAAARGKPKPAARDGRLRERMTKLREEAFEHLDEARRISPAVASPHGLGSVHIAYGYLHLDNGDFDRADHAAAATYDIAEQRTDYTLMARARVLQCMVENGRVEEEIGDAESHSGHAHRALDAARQAVEMARHTDNRRLLAMAYVWQGLTESNEAIADFEAAQHSYDHACAALKGEDAGNLAADLATLKSRLFRTGSVNPILRAWADGIVGDKSFQEIEEEFAEIVIPKVWEREGKKISRVAKRLSMSPKKVRRILDKAVRRSPRK